VRRNLGEELGSTPRPSAVGMIVQMIVT